MSEADPVSPACRRACRGALLRWFEANRRDLPWRRRRTPYRVWISELMLQQTRVDQAAPYFLRFMRRFPGLRSLAEAPLAEVLKQWEGLGYYRRAASAHATARHLMEERGGRFPDTLEGLLALPGIGPYTAAAIGSLALGLDAAVVDGNVIRVLSRLLACCDDVGRAATRRRLQAVADHLLPPGRAAVFNEAVMELGATVCTPRQPACPACPLRRVCAACAEGQPEAYPVKRKGPAVPHKHVGAALVMNARGEVLIAQRRDGDMLGGLWEFPGGKQEPGESLPACVARELREELGFEAEVLEHAVTVAHAFSHFTMDLHVYRARVLSGRPHPVECADCRWVRPAQLASFAFGRADRKVMEALGPELRGPARDKG